MSIRERLSIARVHRVAVAAAFVLTFVLACQPGSLRVVVSDRSSAATSTLPPPASYAGREISLPEPRLGLTGDPSFTDQELNDDRRAWYERLRAAVESSRAAMIRRADRGDAYDYGRWLFQYHSALLVGLRSTGDLRFLDEVDVVAQTMRGELADRWCGGVDRSVYVNVRYGTVTEPDGYRNFRLAPGSVRDACRDTGDLNETLVHGHLAMVMYAYHANRDLESPAGIDYGERADFWFDYLRNDFEAKWRQRSNTAWPAMDFIDLKFCHTYSQMILFHHFMGKRLADDGSADATPYLRQVMRLTDGLFDSTFVPGRAPGGFIEVDTPEGPAVVYPFGAPGNSDVQDVSLQACPVTYARYMATSLLVLHMEGVDRWDDWIATRVANGVAHFVLDTDPLGGAERPIAAGVSGDRRVEGLPPPQKRSRPTLEQFTIAPFAAYSVWNASGKLERLVLEAYELTEPDPDAPERVFIPAGMLFAITVADGRD